MERIFMLTGAASAFLAVAAGAFGAHVLKARLTAEMLSVFEVGVRYHMYHAIGLIAVAWACTKWPDAATSAAGWLFIIGTVIFSGSLYALALTGVRWLGVITPLGGIAFLGGWLSLAWGVWRN
jgi:uncharacterized membrane protein YgdD (TMEM256/DUF423 family)